MAQTAADFQKATTRRRLLVENVYILIICYRSIRRCYVSTRSLFACSWSVWTLTGLTSRSRRPCLRVASVEVAFDGCLAFFPSRPPRPRPPPLLAAASTRPSASSTAAATGPRLAATATAAQRRFGILHIQHDHIIHTLTTRHRITLNKMIAHW